jgi:hypothetical protein
MIEGQGGAGYREAFLLRNFRRFAAWFGLLAQEFVVR